MSFLKYSVPHPQDASAYYERRVQFDDHPNAVVIDRFRQRGKKEKGRGRKTEKQRDRERDRKKRDWLLDCF